MMTNGISVTKEFSWAMAHMLANHEGLCKNLHGHEYRMLVTVAKRSGKLITKRDDPEEGMIVDFKELGRIVKETVVAPLDHATMISSSSNDKFERELGYLLSQFNKKSVVVPYRPTAENMAQEFFYKLQDRFKELSVPYDMLSLRLYETPTSYAEVTI